MIMQVNPQTFKKQKFLEELHLAQNNISKLTAEMFKGLSSLIVSYVMGLCINVDNNRKIFFKYYINIYHYTYVTAIHLYERLKTKPFFTVTLVPGKLTLLSEYYKSY